MKLSVVVKSVVCRGILGGSVARSGECRWLGGSVARRLGSSVARSESVGGSEGRARVRAGEHRRAQRFYDLALARAIRSARCPSPGSSVMSSGLPAGMSGGDDDADLRDCRQCGRMELHSIKLHRFVYK